MKMLKQLGIIVGICMVCEGISGILPVSFPASVIAMMVVLVLLMSKRLKLEQVDTVSNFLLGNLPLLFIPPTVSIMNYWDDISDDIVPFVIICLFTLVLTYVVTAWSVTLTVKLMNKRKKK